MPKRLAEMWRRIRSFLSEGMWRAELQPRTWTARGVALLQFLAMVGEGVVRDRLLLRASALTYFAILSIIPLLAIALTLADAFGVRENLGDRVVSWVTAAVPEARAFLLQQVERARQVSLRGLGTLGAATLVVTTVLGLGNVERAFNAIWGVTQPRGVARRFADYLAVLIVAPMLLGTALSLTTTLESQWLVQRLLDVPTFSRLYDLGLQQLPLLLLSLGFGFLYWFLPNTAVRPASALVGGIAAALLTVAAVKLYTNSGVGVARASALYAGYWYVAVFFVYLYVQWAIVLIGAEASFAYQNLELYRREVRGERAGSAEREAIGMRIAVEIGRAFRDGARPLSAADLADLLSVPVRTVRAVLAALQARRIVAALDGAEREDGWQLGRPAERIQVVDVLAALRGPREPLRGDPSVVHSVDGLLAELAEGEAKAAAGQTLADVLSHIPPSDAPPPGSEPAA